MSRTSTTRLLVHERHRILSSPVARAFVRIVVARRGVTEAKARRIYLEYLVRNLRAAAGSPKMREAI
jgi:hypothetical protein